MLMKRSNSISYIQIDAKQELKKNAANISWLVLALSCGIMFGNYYAYDNPAALNRPLQDWMGFETMGAFNYWLSLCYSVYSFPNIFLPLLAGSWMENYGLKKSLMILSILVCLGQAFFSQGVSAKNANLTLLGRLIFGLGGECLAVAQARLVTEWFLNKELALALGMNLSVARVGTIVNNVMSAWIYERWGIEAAVWTGFATCVISTFCSLGTILITNHCNKNISPSRAIRRNCPNSAAFINGSFWLILLVCFLYYGAIIPYNNVASDLLARRNYLTLGQANIYMSVPDF